MKRFGMGLFLVTCIVSSCAPKMWKKPGASQAEFSKTRFDCLTSSQQPYASSAFDASGGNAESKLVTNNNLFTACMNSNGWFLTDKASGGINTSSEVVTKKDPEIDAAVLNLQKQTLQLCTDIEFHPYFAKVPCEAFAAKPEQLQDKSKLNNIERKIALKVDAKKDRLQSDFFEVVTRRGGDKGRAFVALQLKRMKYMEALRLKLNTGKISVGEYLTELKKIPQSLTE